MCAGPALMTLWSKAFPLTASCLLPLPGFVFQPGHVTRFPLPGDLGLCLFSYFYQRSSLMNIPASTYISPSGIFQKNCFGNNNITWISRLILGTTNMNVFSHSVNKLLSYNNLFLLFRVIKEESVSVQTSMVWTCVSSTVISRHTYITTRPGYW